MNVENIPVSAVISLKQDAAGLDTVQNIPNYQNEVYEVLSNFLFSYIQVIISVQFLLK